MSEPRTETVVAVPVAFSDDRGDILNVTQWCTDRFGVVGHVAVITSRKGSRRASHWHPEDHQIMYLVSGGYRAISQEVDEHGHLVPGTLRYQFVHAGEAAYCPPGLAHAYEFLVDSVFLNITVDAREEGRFEEHTVRLAGWPPPDGHGDLDTGPLLLPERRA